MRNQRLEIDETSLDETCRARGQRKKSERATNSRIAFGYWLA